MNSSSLGRVGLRFCRFGRRVSHDMGLHDRVAFDAHRQRSCTHLTAANQAAESAMDYSPPAYVAARLGAHFVVAAPIG